MGGPWEQYQGQSDGPWSKYASAAPADAPPAATVPAPHRTALQSFSMGARGVLTGLGGLADTVANVVDLPVNAALAATGHQTLPASSASEAAGNLSDRLGLTAPQTDSEKFNDAIIQGGTQAAATGGLAGIEAGAEGAIGAVSRTLAANPIKEIIGGAVSGASSEKARQAGWGPIGQLAAGVVGGGLGVGGAARAERTAARVAERFGPAAVKVVTDVPKSVAVDAKGELTPEGREIAAANDLHPDQVKGAYTEAETAAAEPGPKRAVWNSPEGPHPVEVTGEAQVTDAGSMTPVKSEVHGGEGHVPSEHLTPVEEQVATPGEAVTRDPAIEAANDPAGEPLPASAVDRVNQAQTEGIGLTKGQATQDFATQEKEQTLQAMQSPEGNAARQFYIQQQQQIGDALDRFKSAFGDTAATAAERGQLVKDALTQLRDSGKAGVTALYKQARELAEGAGSTSANLIHLDTAPLLAKMREIFVDEAVPDQVRKALKQQAAKYGLIGDNPKTVEGETTVTLRDSAGEPAGKVTFTGPPQRLTITNAEDLRQKVNQLYEADTSKASQSLKPILDQAVSDAVERAASEGTGDVGKAFKQARAAHIDQVQTFKAKDVIQKLIDWKKGTQTPVVLPENAIREIFAGGKESVTNLKKVKAVLLSKPSTQSKAAWQAIQAHGVAQIFDQAMVINSNPGGGMLGTVSGAKLNTAIAKFGVDKLKVLLSEPDFNQLMKLRRIVGDATIPISRTTNPSGSGYAVIRFLAGQGMKLGGAVAHFVPGVGPIAHAAAGLARLGRESAEAKATLKGVEEFTPAAAEKLDTKAAEKATTEKPDPIAWARQFLNVAASDQIIAPIIASAANEERP